MPGIMNTTGAALRPSSSQNLRSSVSDHRILNDLQHTRGNAHRPDTRCHNYLGSAATSFGVLIDKMAILAHGPRNSSQISAVIPGDEFVAIELKGSQLRFGER